MSRAHPHLRRWLAGIASGSLIATGLGISASSADPADDTATDQPDTEATTSEPASVAASVQEDIAAQGEADFWIRFENQPDLTPAYGISDWDERGWFVYTTLTEAADASQAEVAGFLDSEGATYSAYWINNSIRVEAGDQALLDAVTTYAGVEQIFAEPQVEFPDPVILPGADSDLIPFAPEWGVADINAPQVWDELGIDGDGIVIGTIDSGAEYDHPALIEQYRGNLGNGDFDHNYNWYDWGHGNPDEPRDTDSGFSHGTHVTGTIVGDDGDGNQIGVAPGAQWIAANGCCPGGGFEPLVASGQWMLAPTDLEGENPDPAQRPHIINNSWGAPSNIDDPTYDPVSDAWAAAGQMGVWALGNSGPGCATAGTPGNRPNNFSVGNYDINHNIATLSSRGPNYDGEIKPELGAPGSNVRSSVIGGGYNSLSGTSMASPHAAGAVALLWSGAPSLVGDIDATWDLLTGTTIPVDATECGGTVENNNVFGHGRLDAFALLSEAPLGDTGVLEGTVIDSASGDGIAGATVEITDGEDINRVVTTNADGEFQSTLAVGVYDLTASAFGYSDGTAEATITEDETTTVTIELEPTDNLTLSGTVVDGSGQGWPLYAEVSVDGTPASTFTDPETGEYTLEVPPGDYTVTAQAQYPGYNTGSEEVVLGELTTLDAEVNFALTVQLATCQAPGYELVISDFLPAETFDAETVPEGWTVTDDEGAGFTWVFDNPGNRTNLTGGEGNFAIVDSDNDGSAANHDTSLITPALDFSDADLPVLEFKQDYFQFITASTAYVDYSIDGGDNWINLLTQTTSDRGPSTVQLYLDDAVGESEVHVRFRLVDPGYSWWWQIDDVAVFSQACEPLDGGLVVGNVYDDNTGAGINGATVTNLTTEESISTVGTDDPALDDGFYHLFSPSGTHDFQAMASGYETSTESVSTVDGDVVRQDFDLGSPFLEWTPESIETTVVLGDDDTVQLEISNTGTGAAEVELQELAGEFELLRADGTVVTLADILASSGAPEIALEVDTSFAASGSAGANTEAEPHYGPTEEPWTDLTPYPAPLMDGRAVNLDGVWYNVAGGSGSEAYDTVYRYNTEDLAWESVASLPTARNAVSAGVIDGQIVVNGGWFSNAPDASTYIYDPSADAWTEGADAPVAVSAAGVAEYGGLLYSVGGCTTADCTPMSNAVQAYDPASDSWEQLADYPAPAAFPVCGGLGDGVYCTGGNDGVAGTAASYYYDPSADSWSELPDAPADTWAAAGAAANGMLVVTGGVQGPAVSNVSFAYDPDEGAWIDLPNANQARYRGSATCGFARIGGSSGGFVADPHSEFLPGFDECAAGATDVPWLELDEYVFDVPAGDSVTVTVTTDSSVVALPGTYTAGIRITSNAPGSAPEVPVTMNVAAPLHWGKILGQVDGDTDGVVEPLAGAGVDIAPQSDDYDGWFLTTDSEGAYATWIDTRVGALDLTATFPGFRPDIATDVVVPRGTEVVQDFLLQHLDNEVPVDPIHPNVDRIYGSDRYGTAAAISARFEPGVDVVFVASGANFPDALTGAALAGNLDAPILLTRPDRVPLATEQELQRLAPQQVVILGGYNAIHEDVEEYIEGLAGSIEVDRWAGGNRFETAALVAQQYDSAETVYIATGADYPDALAAATRAGLEGVPVLLVRHHMVPNATAAELIRLSPDRIVVLGGEMAISEDVEEALEEFGDVDRVAGETRAHTAAALFADYPTAGDVYVAAGNTWPDAISGAGLAASTGSPMLLVANDGVPGVTWDVLTVLKPENIYAIGGPDVIQEVVLDQLRTLE